ncbi:MAG: GHKL domain-containing protein [Bacteroidales bacterium]|jgi:signal transduction histidine kinase|nr:GHKL domain-containing protein [Bacteroidales bacterium]
MKKFRIIFFFIVLFLFTISLVSLIIIKLYYPFSVDENINKNLIERVINEKNNKLNNYLDKVIEIEKNNPEKLHNYFCSLEKNLYKEEGIGLFFYSNNELNIWTTNDIPIPTSATLHFFDKKIINLNNGWYLCSSVNLDNYSLVSLFQIKKEYSYLNDNLFYDYFPDFKLQKNIILSTDFINNATKINIPDSNEFFYLSVPNNHKEENNVVLNFFLVASIVLFYLLIFSILNVFVKKYKKNNLGIFILFSFIIILSRLFLLYFNCFSTLVHLDFFNPNVFGQSFLFPSLADLTLNIVLFFIFSIFFYNNLIIYLKIQEKRPLKIILNISIAILMILSVKITSIIFYGLVINSSISFDFSNIFVLNIFSVLGSLVLLILLLSFAIIFIKLEKLLKDYLSYIVIIILLILFFATGKIYYFDNIDTFSLIIFNILFLLFYSFITFFILKNKNSYTNKIIFFIIISAIISLNFSHLSLIKEKEKNKILLYNLADDSDIIAEYFLKQTEDELKNNSEFQELINNHDYTNIDNYINNKIKNKRYFNKYESYLTICNSDDSIEFYSGLKANCFHYFDSIIQKKGIKISNSDFYFIKNIDGTTYYIGEIGDSFKDSNNFRIFLELKSKVFSEGLGYPELLLDKRLIVEKDLKLYNYLKYNNNNLIKTKYQFEDNYSTFIENIDTIDYYFTKENGYINFTYKSDDENFIVLRKPYNQLFNDFISFAYIFIVSFILFNFYRFIKKIAFDSKRKILNLRIKIYLSSVLTMLLSLLVLGFISVYFINQTYKQKQEAILQEKIKSIVFDLETFINLGGSINYTDIHELNKYLIDLSNIYLTDINVYDLKGILISSSRTEFYDFGLKGRYIHPQAYNDLIINKKGFSYFKDKIDNVGFLSAYFPFRNDESQIIAYLNLPSFVRQNEYISEISNFVTTYINIFFILLLISIFIGLIISQQISQPLALIQDKLRSMKLNEKNEKIIYSKNDEIRSLIDEYNNKIDELSVSAEKLAQSERETAWREMAKQIAHEIKNPLTPMKLNLQFLLQTYKQDDENWKNNFVRMANNIIEQIDTLSNIASEFSNFAKMPIAQKTKCDIKEIIQNSVSLFNNLRNNLEIIQNFDSGKNYFIFADREQMLRVFNNIIKNAIQAISQDKNGEISINIIEQENKFLIEIRDNGCGIPDDIASKIFIPNFTTKNSGMGLGLSMVKNMLLSNNANISFKTKKNIGTKFIIEIEKYKENLKL